MSYTFNKNHVARICYLEVTNQESIIMKALVLAAGLGTRLRPYTFVTPKPLFTICGIPILDRIINQLVEAGCTSIMVNTHHLSDKIKEHVEKTSYGADVRISHEPVVLETGGAVKNLGTFWDDTPFFVVNSDIHTDFDFSAIYRKHLETGAIATLLVHDDARFNNVAVDIDGKIIGFRVNAVKTGRLLAFTGIQVVSPEILDVIPEDIPYSIIDAYKRLLDADKRIDALVADKLEWEDIGTPDAYVSLSRRAMIDRFFGTKLNQVGVTKLKGDGSDRSWFRVSSDGKTVLLAEHGIRNTEAVCEADSFSTIGRHLEAKRIPASEILAADIQSGLVFIGDLGNTHLADYVASASKSEIEAIYKDVIKALVLFSQEGIKGFDEAWAWQTPSYSKEMVLEKECNYFRDSFLKNYLGLEIDDSRLIKAFEHVSHFASSLGTTGLMHRDCQSRNIMISNGKPYFIDYQGARTGPFQYDLASLLIDPYVFLSDDIVKNLEDYAFQSLSAFSGESYEDFMKSLAYCRVARNLQFLGAFSFLSRVKDKKDFEQYIPSASSSLVKNLYLLPDQEAVSDLLAIAIRALDLIR